MKFSGIYTALITPFLNGEVDYNGWRENIAFQMENKIDGIVILGTTGEAPTLTPDEKYQLITTAIKATSGNLPVIVGTGSYSTAQTITFTKQAYDLGADAALVITPYYNRPMPHGIIAHYNAVADATPLPLIVYHHPPRTGCTLSLETLQQLAAHPRIAAIKECSPNLDLFETLARTVDIPILTGIDEMIWPTLQRGGKGAISVASNLIPKQMLQMNEQSFHTLLPLFDALCLETNPIPIKAALNLCGRPAGSLRLPLTDATAATIAALQPLLDEALCGC